MTRRGFLKTTFGSAGSLAVCRSGGAGPAAGVSDPGKFILSAPLTHSDWMLKPNISWGPDGVRHMLDACKECGWSRIYWRALDGGRALYRSKLLTPMGKWDEDSFWNPQTPEDAALQRRFTAGLSDDRRKELLKKFDELRYSEFDPLAEAVPYGHEIGVQVHAWVSINEDDHGWGLRSEFSRDHPEYRWRRRDGRMYHSQLSFAFPEVRRYKLAILEELMRGYAIDGFFIDWIRTGDVRDNPQNDEKGVADYGYEEPLTKSGLAERENGDDEWVRVRAQPQTEFMREARKLLLKGTSPLPLAVMVGHPWHYRGEQNKIAGNLRGLLLDVRTWAREGLIDSAVAAGYYLPGGDAVSAAQALREETESKVDVWTYAWVPGTVADAEQSFAIAEKVGAKQILYWEADYIDDRGNAGELKDALRQRAV